MFCLISWEVSLTVYLAEIAEGTRVEYLRECHTFDFLFSSFFSREIAGKLNKNNNPHSHAPKAPERLCTSSPGPFSRGERGGMRERSVPGLWKQWISWPTCSRPRRGQSGCSWSLDVGDSLTFFFSLSVLKFGKHRKGSITFISEFSVHHDRN